MKKKQIILSKEEINNKINRISFSIIEDYYQEKVITLIGFAKNGYVIAQKLKHTIEKKHKIKISLHQIKVKEKDEYEIYPPLEHNHLKHVFLVDDVLKSGRTIIYGIKEILKYKMTSLKTIILVNRNHNEFPIGVDYVGLNLSTTLKDHIEVILKKNQEIAYLM